MQVSIIIPFHNEAAHLKRTLDHFVAQHRRPDLVLLVNDSSSDESPKSPRHSPAPTPSLNSFIAQVITPNHQGLK